MKKIAGVLVKYWFLCPVLIKATFEYLYINLYSPRYSYLGAYLKVNYDKCILSWLLLLFFIICVKCIRAGKLKACTVLFMYISIIPSLSIYWLKDENTTVFFLIVLYWTMWMFSVFLFGNDNKLSEKRTFMPLANSCVMYIITAWLILSTLYFSYTYGGLRLFVSFADVYKYRLATDNSMGRYAVYLFNWNANVIIPLCMMIHLYNKQYKFVVIDTILMLMSYSIYGNKSMFVTILLVLGIAILFKCNIAHYTEHFVGLFIILYSLLCMVLPEGTVKIWAIALYGRVLEGPAAGHYNYYDYFSTRALLYLRESIFRHFWASPYEKLTSIIIGSSDKYYTGRYNNMNNGLFSAAYANFGPIGVIIQPIVLVLTFRYVLKRLYKYDESVQYVWLIMSVFYLISTTYFGWLMTGGVFVVLFLLILFEHDKTINPIIRIRPLKGMKFCVAKKDEYSLRNLYQ